MFPLKEAENDQKKTRIRAYEIRINGLVMDVARKLKKSRRLKTTN
jgi:hypothetical protein